MFINIFYQNNSYSRVLLTCIIGAAVSSEYKPDLILNITQSHDMKCPQDLDVTFYSFYKRPRRTSTTFKVAVSHFVFYPCGTLLIHIERRTQPAARVASLSTLTTCNFTESTVSRVISRVQVLSCLQITKLQGGEKQVSQSIISNTHKRAKA